MAIVSDSDLIERIIEPSAFVADAAAFVDVRIPKSVGKASYSFIGPGVSQNAEQTVNLNTPHGFNVGAATVPSGSVNNPHLHYTAEVFICTRGKWRFLIGEHGEQSIDLSAGEVLSVPPWIFRGFENIGDDDGWLFVVLGGDDTGGIIWAPSVLRAAAETGLYLGEDYAVLDAHAGDDVSGSVRPLEADELVVDDYSDNELLNRRVSFEQLKWSDHALLSSTLEAHRSRVAPLIGYGMTQARRVSAPIEGPHKFSMEWLEVAPGSSTGLHRHDQSQVLFLLEGDWEVAFNEPEGRLTARPITESIVSVPAGAWRDFVNVGDGVARAVVVNGGDAPVSIEWAQGIVESAREAGWALDHSGCVAPAHLIGRRS